jgi:chitinase
MPTALDRTADDRCGPAHLAITHFPEEPMLSRELLTVPTKTSTLPRPARAGRRMLGYAAGCAWIVAAATSSLGCTGDADAKPGTSACAGCDPDQTCNASGECQTGSSSSLAKHALIGYWHDFTNPSGCPIPIGEVSDDWDVIVVAFAENDPQSNGTVQFTPFPGTPDCSAIDPDQLKVDIAKKQAAGKVVALSLGGAEGTITLNTDSDETNFVNTLTGVIKEWGFDGIDVDLESGSGLVHGAQIQSRLVTAIKTLNTNVGGNMYLSMAPEHPYVQGGAVAYSGLWGAYLPIIDGLRDELDLLHVQLYNNNSVPTPNVPAYQNGKTYPEGSVDNLVVSATMLMEGFTMASGSTFKGLPASKVAFGLPSGPSSSNSPVTSDGAIESAFLCITQKAACGEHMPKTTYPDFRGVMAWSINWDRHDGYPFSKPLAAVLHK